jgi:NTE family protein
VAYSFEFTDVTPEIAAQVSPGLFPEWHDELNTIKASLIFDSLDDVIIPRNGLYITADYERSHKWFGSSMDYDKFRTHGTIYNTFWNKHTLSLSGSFMFAWGNLPTYKFFNFGGADDFPGLDYSQVLGTRFYLAGASYRYEFKNDIFFKIFANSSFDHNFGSETDPIYGEPFFGYGASIIFDSILGPLELTVAQADETPVNPGTKETQVYFSAGYEF